MWGTWSTTPTRGEDKIAKKARLEQLEPMEVAHYYTERYHRAMDALNVETPSIEPYASGHIIEQIEFVKRILADGYAYEANGSVYFDVEKYNAKYNYGRLSGRNLDDIVANTRELDGQSDKRHSYDFALWKKASPEHIMRWPSPWGEGFPGWHMECSAMSTALPRGALRHPRRRHGPDVPAPRVRDRAVDRRAGPRFGPLLAAQQHDDGQRAEDGQVAGQLHHP